MWCGCSRRSLPRYRVNIRPIAGVPRTADLVFTKAKVAVFLDGCFWHGCAKHYRPAKGKTAEFWNGKIAGNRRRDADTDERLHQAGWEVMRVWEHEDPAQAASPIAERVKNRRSPTPGPADQQAGVQGRGTPALRSPGPCRRPPRRRQAARPWAGWCGSRRSRPARPRRRSSARRGAR
ncbi:MAG TPA: hypothetical protein DHU96_23190 [Actinobacteria bacterium]|nr:hypothetical protein [Actinomycetota bacterium]